jgi:hypothetical protein
MLVSLIALAKEIGLSVDISETQKSSMLTMYARTSVFFEQNKAVGSTYLECGATLKWVRSGNESTGQNRWRD